MRLGVWVVPVMALMELLSIILMADWVGAGFTLLLIAAGIVLGGLMLRHLGVSALLMVGSTVKSPEGRSLYQLLWPIRFAAAALLLISPGFFSDLVAIALMLPFKGKNLPDIAGGAHSQRRRDDDIIDVEYTVDAESSAREILPPSKES